MMKHVDQNSEEEQRLQDELTDYYQSKSLRPELMQELLSHKPRKVWMPWNLVLSAAAMVLVAIAALFVHQHQLTSDRTQVALLEASTNHVTKLQFEFEPETVEELEQSMDRLSFALRLPSLSEIGPLKIEGARYCTISGNLAAHLKFTNLETQEPISLFVTADVDNLHTIGSTPATISGVDVKLWREKGMFYALASSGEG